MHVLNVVSVIAAKEGGGNGERATQLSRALSEAGVRTTVLSLAVGDAAARQPHLGMANLVTVPAFNRRYQVPQPSRSAIRELVQSADIVQSIGYWSLLGVAVCSEARAARIPYVISPAGALPIFGRSRTIKRLFRAAIGRRLVSQASGWVAITPNEVGDFVEYGVEERLVRVFPNGVSEVDFAPGGVRFRDAMGLPDAPFLLFVGRLNPIKGPDLLLEAFAALAAKYADLHLVFAGPDEGMGAQLAQYAATAGLGARVHLVGFVSGQIKANAYREAALLVVPSRSEAMSIVAVEAGICGTPALMTDQCGLSELAEVDRSLVVPASIEGLEQGLRFALADRTRLAGWGQQWQTIVRARFQWKDIARGISDYFADIIAQS